MIDATRMCCGYCFLILAIFGTHQSSVLSEMSSQFHDECSTAPGRFCIERRAESALARMNFVFGPSTLTTGCSPIVFVTTPPQPASNARMMLLSDSVGGADDSRNGFSNRRPVNVVASCAAMGDPPLGNRDYIAESQRRAGLVRPAGGSMPRKLIGGLIQ